MRDQNRDRVDLSNRVTQKDVDRIKDGLGGLCHDEFKAALLEDPAYKLVETFHEGEAVLVVIPSIANLDVAAPDLKTPGMRQTYTTTAGQMTLVLELQDGTTGAVLARVIDRQEAPDFGRMQWTNGVTNRSDADRILKAWAKRLRGALDQVVGKAAS
jgi:hypothetical protein